MNFLLDENFPPQLARALEVLDQEDCCYHHAVPVFGAGAPDAVIFEGVREREWFLVTQDHQMSRRPDQRWAILNAGLGVFVFTGRAEHSFREIAATVLLATDDMLERARTTRRPFIWGISDRRKFTRLDD